MRAGLYARVSTPDQQTLGLQSETMAVYIENRGWITTRRIEDVGSGSRIDSGGSHSYRRLADERST